MSKSQETRVAVRVSLLAGKPDWSRKKFWKNVWTSLNRMKTFLNEPFDQFSLGQCEDQMKGELNLLEVTQTFLWLLSSFLWIISRLPKNARIVALDLSPLGSRIHIEWVGSTISVLVPTTVSFFKGISHSRKKSLGICYWLFLKRILLLCDSCLKLFSQKESYVHLLSGFISFQAMVPMRSRANIKCHSSLYLYPHDTT